MSVIYFLIPISLVVLAVIVAAFFWAVNHNQYDDLEGPAHKILFDEKEEKP